MRNHRPWGPFDGARAAEKPLPEFGHADTSARSRAHDGRRARHGSSTTVAARCSFLNSNGGQLATRREIESILREIGQEQHGVAMRAQLLRRGLASHTIDRMVSAGRVIVLRRGSVPDRPATGGARGRNCGCARVRPCRQSQSYECGRISRCAGCDPCSKNCARGLRPRGACLGLALAAHAVLPPPHPKASALRTSRLHGIPLFAAPYPACTSPCQRFTCTVTRTRA